ncbi:MAG: hypothetical protein JNM70_20205 [Anaerolineae bacterium]|nr:hypothetical protein [Anaerolineae bacterium]
MSARTAVPSKPKLLLEFSLKRRPYFRRALLAFMAFGAGLAALYALHEAWARGQLETTPWLIGAGASILIVVLFGLRFLGHMWRWLRRRDESLKLFNRGLIWNRADEEVKAGWSALHTYREGLRGIYLGGRPLAQWGALTLTLRDGRVLKFTSRLGDLRPAAKLMRRAAAQITGDVMAQALREDRPVRLHRHLTVWPAGVQIKKETIPWAEFDARLANGVLSLYRQGKNGKFRKVRQFRAYQLDNVEGFMEVVRATLPNHQRERFGV